MTKESQYINNPTPAQDVSLKELILKIQEWYRYLISKWGIILFFVILGAALNLMYAFIKSPKYIATTTFVLEEDKSGGGLGSLAGLASIAGVDLGSGGGGIFQGDNILELYKSRSMLEKTLLSRMNSNSKELLIDRYIKLNKLKETWKKKPALLNLKFSPVTNVNDTVTRVNTIESRLRDSVLGKAVENINKSYLNVSKPNKKTSIIRVDVTSKDEVFSKDFNDVLVNNVNDFYIQTKTKKAKDNVAILQSKTDSVRAVMNGDIYAAVAVADATPNLNPTRQVKRIAPAQKSQFSAETNKAVLSELIKNLEMSKISLLKETPLIQVVDQPIYPLEIDKLGKSKAVILGGILFGFLVVLFFSVKFFVRGMLS